MNGLIALALAPVLIIAFYIYFRDKYEKEPWGLLLKAMLMGVIIVFPVIFTEELMNSAGSAFRGVAKGFWDAFMVAALCEEAFKYLAFILLIWKSPSFNEHFDGIVYATFISLGFAGVENILYVMNNGLSTGLVRAFTAVPAHAVFGITMGYFMGLARFYPTKREKYLFASFLWPFALHGFYDFVLMAGVPWLLLFFVPFVALLWITGLRKMKAMNQSSYYNTDIHLGIDFSKVKDYRDDGRSKTED
ncbi:MAG: PrsW family intramembrane metalloprotease [Prolixibacteraceae bacterium]|nr:PrsW family intramembrane metalloprotease [Prolixibacteraceae bacterium]